jgi:hypothetical protein
MKKIKEFFKELLGAIWVLFIMMPGLFVLPVILFIAYLIATSNLPDWFKFFLLR